MRFLIRREGRPEILRQWATELQKYYAAHEQNWMVTSSRWTVCDLALRATTEDNSEVKIRPLAAAAYAGWAVGEDVVGPMHALRDALGSDVVAAAINAAKKHGRRRS
jgi:hypothetical protein